MEVRTPQMEVHTPRRAPHLLRITGRPLVRYEILGPVRTIDGGVDSNVNAPKTALLLASLLIRQGGGLTRDELMREIWGENLPSRPVACLHVYVSQLRKLLQPPGAETPLVRSGSGYRIDLAHATLDARDLADTVADARDALLTGRAQQALDHFRAGLALWRGQPLGGLGEGPIVQGFTAWADATKVECSEGIARCSLALGRHQEAITYLEALRAEHPFRESYYHYLMLALYRAGCQVDALIVYNNARTMLSDELGIEPSSMLRDLQRVILRGDPVPGRHLALAI